MAAYSVKAAKTNAPINVATPIAIRTRKNVVMPSNVGAGALVILKQYSCHRAASVQLHFL
jgi:hypothetical protein